MTVNLSKRVQEAMWGDDALLAQLEHLEQLYLAGDKTAVWAAIDFCGHAQLVMPDWLRDAVSAITHGLRSGALRTFDEAFGVKLVSKATRKRAHALENKRLSILNALAQHRLKGGAFTTLDFDRIAEELQVPRNHVVEVYEAHPFLIDLSKDEPATDIKCLIIGQLPIMPKRHGRPIVRDSGE
ncbi:MAG TPA: hypothetical protein VEC01_08035 [Noviherbaspirillum sp.]|uniref:hypothetical protein n=1 Tax=Noviherbaspirillum sp. TaxID=1926288 RepID=UPI002D327ADA|nr:hypothetical protein [Noviherbaspirillum sp.]HYD95259.1 hypothetical protein [Noviherbaspirillum sp.]